MKKCLKTDPPLSEISDIQVWALEGYESQKVANGEGITPLASYNHFELSLYVTHFD
jgi:hypothetical protein